MGQKQANNRRGTDRRDADFGPQPPIGERRSTADCGASGPATFGSSPGSAGERRKADRRVADRRQLDLGPPPSIGERRFRPDPRGVIFVHVDIDP